METLIENYIATTAKFCLYAEESTKLKYRVHCFCDKVYLQVLRRRSSLANVPVYKQLGVKVYKNGTDIREQVDDLYETGISYLFTTKPNKTYCHQGATSRFREHILLLLCLR